MRNYYSSNVFFFFLFLASAAISAIDAGSDLTTDFYRYSCPDAEQIVRRIVWSRVAYDQELAAKFMRMYYHDCMVLGCDASILINSTARNTAEKDAIPNTSLRGFDVIDEVKEALEEACPNTVSCADILALTVRDSVSYQFRGNLWNVKLGRRDGRISNGSLPLLEIPSPLFNFEALSKSFKSKGLNDDDLVILTGGGHTIGIGHCAAFSKRLYNFSGRGDVDPSLNPNYAAHLKTLCKGPSDFTTTVALDPGSANSFDSHFFKNLANHNGLFNSDATLLTNSEARDLVEKLKDPIYFYSAFRESITKLGDIGVLTENKGEIRKYCSVVNEY